MAKNTGDGYRKREVHQRSQLPNPPTNGFIKRDAESGRIIGGKEGPKPCKEQGPPLPGGLVLSVAGARFELATFGL